MLTFYSNRPTCGLSSVWEQTRIQDEHQASILIMLYDRVDRYANYRRRT